MPHRRVQILVNGHIWEEGILLEEIAHSALLGRQINVGPAVEEHPVVQHDAASVGPLDASDAFEGHAFAAAGGPQQSQHATLGFQGDVQAEAAQLLLDLNRKTHSRASLPQRPRRGFLSRRSSRLTASITAAESRMLTPIQLRASSSLPMRQS